MKPPTHRLFVAVELPVEARAALASWRDVGQAPRLPSQDPMASGALALQDLSGFGWVREEQLHLTVRFIGAVSPEPRARLEEVVRGFEVAPFEVAFAGAGAFPAGRAPEVIWVGVGEGAERLAELREKLDALFEEAGAPREERAFHPHVTLARVRDRQAAGAAREWVQRHASGVGLRVHVAGVTLFRTHFGGPVARHEPIARSGEVGSHGSKD